MVAQALAGFPGAEVDLEDGSVTVSREAWKKQRAVVLDQALTKEPLQTRIDAEFPQEAFSLWRPFLWEIQERGISHVKAQLAGPFTIWMSLTNAPEIRNWEAHDRVLLQQDILRWLIQKATDWQESLRLQGTSLVLFWDEPALVALDLSSLVQNTLLVDLRTCVDAVKRLGAQVGIHCCGQTHWAKLLEMKPHFLSFDAGLSLAEIIAEASHLEAFCDSGGILAPGVISSHLNAAQARASLLSIPECFRSSLLLSPCCGLGLSSMSEAERIEGELATLRSLLVSDLGTRY